MKDSVAHRTAVKFINELGISADNLDGSNIESTENVYEGRGDSVCSKIAEMTTAELGEICACGKGADTWEKGTKMWKVYGRGMSWLDGYDDGLTLLRHIAMAVIIAEITDVLEENSKLSEK